MRLGDEKGAAAVEFSLIALVLFMLIFGIIEFARVVGTYSSVQTASREAARYASSVGDNGSGTPRFADCDGIRAAGRRIGGMARFSDADVTISYDDGSGSTIVASCPSGSTIDPDLIDTGDRVIVTVRTTFRSMTPLVSLILDGVSVTSTNKRSIFREG